MPQIPRKPQAGDKVLQSMYDAICQIIDYLPTLEVRGDNTTTSVNHTSCGTIIKAIKPNLVLSQTKKGEGGGEYYADNVSITLNGHTFRIKPPDNPTKNYALCWINGNYVWAELEDC